MPLKTEIHISEGGFSLIELMTVVAIIGILVGIGGPNLQEMLTRLKINLAKATMQEMKHNFVTIRSSDTSEGTLINITGGGCLYCIMGFVLGSATPKGPFNAESLREWKVLGYDSPPKDPWGNYYIFDQNEGESGPGDVRCDTISSAGPDGIMDGWDPTLIVSFGDDIVVGIPLKNSVNPKCF